MKTNRIYGILILILFAGNMFAQQIYLSTNSDESDPANPEYNVNNTGNDMLGYEVGGSPFKMQITVADGNDPHIIYKNENQNSGGLVSTDLIDNTLCPNADIIDPDVVLVNNDAPISGQQTTDVLIIYETTGGDINLVIKTFDNTQGWLYHQNYQNGINIGQGINPNIDISTAIYRLQYNNPPHPNPIAKFVIVWEENGNINSIVGESDFNGKYTFGIIATIYDKSFNGNVSASLPDATISYLNTSGDPYNPSDSWTVTYTFLDEKNKGLLVYQDNYSNIFNGSINSSNLTTRHTFNPSDMMGIPRIASPDNNHGLAPYGVEDYTIVMGGVIVDPDPIYGILGFNRHYNSQTQAYTNNDYNYAYTNQANVYEGNPVIAYAGDIAIVVWEIDAWIGNGFGLDGRDIIQHQLTYDGSFATNYYSLVNMDVTKTQEIPSVAADYSYDVLYSFYDENDLNIKFKTSQCNSQVLRIKKEDNVLGIYPNPATDFLNVNLQEDAFVRIYDLHGRQVLNKNLKSGNHKLDISVLSKGVYIIKLESNIEVKAERIIVY